MVSSQKRIGKIIERSLCGLTAYEIAPEFGLTSHGMRCLMSRHGVKMSGQWRRRYGVKVDKKQHDILQELSAHCGIPSVKILEMLIHAALAENAHILRRTLGKKLHAKREVQS
jgi:hypothetical protein